MLLNETYQKYSSIWGSSCLLFVLLDHLLFTNQTIFLLLPFGLLFVDPQIFYCMVGSLACSHANNGCSQVVDSLFFWPISFCISKPTRNLEYKTAPEIKIFVSCLKPYISFDEYQGVHIFLIASHFLISSSIPILLVLIFDLCFVFGRYQSRSITWCFLLCYDVFLLLFHLQSC